MAGASFPVSRARSLCLGCLESKRTASKIQSGAQLVDRPAEPIELLSDARFDFDSEPGSSKSTRTIAFQSAECTFFVAAAYYIRRT